MPGGAGDTRKWLKRAKRLGLRIEAKGSETRVTGHDGRRICITGNRRDAPRCLVTMVRQAEKEKR